MHPLLLLLPLLPLASPFLLPPRAPFRPPPLSGADPASDPSSATKGVPITLTEPLSTLPSLVPHLPERPSAAKLDGAKLEKEKGKVSLEAAQAYVLKARHDFVTRGGVCVGDAVTIDWDATCIDKGDGPWVPGQKMKGVKAKGQLLDVREDYDDGATVWSQFSRGVLGAGQMSSNTFEVQFPGGHPTPVLRGVRCRVTALVRSIG